MSLRSVLNAMKELVSTSTAPAGDDAESTSRLTQCLRANLKSYRELLQKADPNYRKLQSRVLHFKDEYHLNHSVIADQTLDGQLQAHDTYREFVPEGLSLLLVLDEILLSLHKEDASQERSAAQTAYGSSSGAVPPRAPKSLLSISDQKSVTSLAQFVVSLGIFPCLMAPLDSLLKIRLNHAKMVEKYNDKMVSSDERARYLYEVCRVLVQCFGNPVLGPSLLSRHISDVLVALLQICYSPREGSHNKTEKRDSSNRGETEVLRQHNTPGDVKIKRIETDSSDDSRTASSLSFCEREWCVNALQRLLNNTYQPLVVRELLAVQQISSMQGPTTRGKCPQKVFTGKKCSSISPT